MRDALVPPIRTISTFVLSGARVSSGAVKLRTSNPAIETSYRRHLPHGDPNPTPEADQASAELDVDDRRLASLK
jgi:hypothetical protein